MLARPAAGGGGGGGGGAPMLARPAGGGVGGGAGAGAPMLARPVAEGGGGGVLTGALLGPPNMPFLPPTFDLSEVMSEPILKTLFMSESMYAERPSISLVMSAFSFCVSLSLKLISTSPRCSASTSRIASRCSGETRCCHGEVGAAGRADAMARKNSASLRPFRPIKIRKIRRLTSVAMVSRAHAAKVGLRASSWTPTQRSKRPTRWRWFTVSSLSLEHCGRNVMASYGYGHCKCRITSASTKAARPAWRRNVRSARHFQLLS